MVNGLYGEHQERKTAIVKAVREQVSKPLSDLIDGAFLEGKSIGELRRLLYDAAPMVRLVQ